MNTTLSNIQQIAKWLLANFLLVLRREFVYKADSLHNNKDRKLLRTTREVVSACNAVPTQL